MSSSASKSAMDADAIDLSKENIQPLRQGRKAQMLGLALQAETDDDVHKKILQERDEYEMKIRLYEGDDPLQPRYDYVQWLEQTYPKHGRECNLVPLLEDTITVYKDDKRYRQDPRFIQLIVKFIETQVNSLELYQVVYNLEIGTKCSLFYKAWADELDCSNDIKRADQIYKLGIENKAEPLESLELDHKQFQLSVGRRMMSGEEFSSQSDKNENQPQRQVLGKLKGKVGSLRPTLGKAGVVPFCLVNRNLPSNASNTPLSIYTDEVDSSKPFSIVENYKAERLPKSDLAKKENSLKPGVWNKPYKTPRTQVAYTPSTPRFKIHEDNVPCTPKTPMSVCPSALKTRKGEFHCPVAIFEPPDPSVKPMYCKSKIYVGGREYQFEEIQAAMYFKKLRDKVSQEEMEKLGIKMSSLACDTPLPLKKQSSQNKEEMFTPSHKDANLIDKEVEPSTPHPAKKNPTELSTPLQSTSSFHFKTPYQEAKHYQPITPFDFPSQSYNEIVMEGAETSLKLPPPQHSSISQPAKKDPKPVASTSNVKKFLNFSIYCDDN